VESGELRPKQVSQEVFFSSSFPQKGTSKNVQRTNLCPPVVTRSVVSGPWSLEWLNDHNYSNVGLIFSTKKKYKQTKTNSGSRRRKRRKSVAYSKSPCWDSYRR